MYEFYLHVCKCSAWVCTSGSQKRALASLELELWTIVSHHVGPGTGSEFFLSQGASSLGCAFFS